MKPALYTQLYVQIVFAVENKQCLLRNKKYNGQIFEYISGTINNVKNKPIIVNGVEDHNHIFYNVSPTGKKIIGMGYRYYNNVCSISIQQ
jgi:hypothetical protein